jgi:signal transduction histidine kinase/DNA-binding response OmpR family regulator
MLTESTKILVVDDEKGMCESLRALLTNAGYQVTTAEQGEEALSKIQDDKFDLVLTDIRMPRVDGLDILKAVRNKDEEALVILMTGYASLESAVSAISQGAYDYLMKPLEFSDLKLTIRRALDKRKADREKNELLAELKRKNQELKKRVAELNALHKAGTSLSTTKSLKVLLDKIVSLATDVMEAESGSIMLIQSPGNFLTIEAAIGLSDEIVHRTKLELGSSIAGHVAQTRTPLVVKDIEQDSRFSHFRKKHYATKSLLCVPLTLKDKVLGVINLSDKKGGGAFSHNDLKLLTTFASQAAIAIDDTEQFSENQRKIEELEVLYDIAGRLSLAEEFEEICRLIFERVQKITPVEFAVWFSWNEKAGELVAGLFQGCKNGRRHIGVPLDRDEISDGEKVNAKIKAALSAHPDLAEHTDSTVSFPIIAERCVHGVLSVGNRQGKQLSQEQRRLISIVVSQAASAYEKQRSLMNATRLVTMGNLVSEITHDLKKPLTNLKGTLQLLREKWSNAKDKEKYFNLVEEEIFHLDGLVKEIVSFSNPYKYETEKKDIVAILSRALKLVERDLAGGKIVLKKNLIEGYTVMVDKNQIMEVFLNIILNAIEAMPQGGELTVENRLHRAALNGSEYMRVAITDTGCGIAPENLSRLFDRYFTTKKEGTGLGLAVVDRVVKAHGGSVSVESQLGKGTTFYVDLPLA